MLAKHISNFILDFILGFLEVFGISPENGIKNVFFIELLMNNNIFKNTYEAVVGFASLLLAFKVLKKFSDIYFLGIEGDMGESPINILVRFIKAISITLLFPSIYKIYTNIVIEFYDLMYNKIVSSTASETNNSEKIENFLIDLASNISGQAYLIMLVFVLIFVVLFLVMQVQLFLRGFEMLILRIGFPIATIGIIDSDNGVYLPYIKLIFQTTISTLVQLLLFALAIKIFEVSENNVSGMILTLATLMMAIRGPKFIQQFMLPTSGGGKLQSGMMVVNNLRKFVK